MKILNLRLAVAGALGALAVTVGAAETHARFCEFVPGAIRPAGHLAEFLARERSGMLGNRKALGYPFDTGLWSEPIRGIHFTEGVYNGDDEDQSGKKDWWSAGAWWPFEQTAYLLDAMIRTANLISAPELEAEYRKSIESVLAHQQPDGDLFQYLSRSDSQWPMAVFFRSAWAYADRTGDTRVWEAFAKHYDGKRAVRRTWDNRDMLNIEGLLKTMDHTGDKSLLADAVACWEGSSVARRLATETRVHEHGVSFAEYLKIPVLLYGYTGERRYLDLARRAYRNAIALNEQASGQISCNEFLSGRDPRQGYESCVAADLMWTLGYFIAADFDVDAADRMEKIAYNVVPGAITKDFCRHQYLSAVNQFACTPFAQSAHFNYGEAAWRQYRPAHFPQCCTGNILRALPAFVQRMWLRDAKSGAPVAMLFGPSAVTGEYGGVAYEIREETNYPFEDEIRFTVTVARPVEMPVAYRIPAWAERPDAGTLVTETRRWEGEQTFTVSLPAKVKLNSDRNWHWYTRGPLTFSYAIPSEVVTERPGDRFSPLRIEPSGDWNFAFDLDEIAAPAFVVRRPAPAFPFETPAMTLTVPVREIKEWQVLDEQRFTPDPPLYTHPTGKRRTIELVPYATTLARITCFPDTVRRRQLPVVAAYTTGKTYDFDPEKPLAEQVYAPESWTDKQFRKLYKVPQRTKDLYFDFHNYFGDVTNRLTYAVFRVWSDVEGEATFCVGAAGRWTATMDGREVASSGDGWVEGELMAPIWFDHPVKKGYNYVLLKVGTSGRRLGQFRKEWGAKIEAFVKDDKR